MRNRTANVKPAVRPFLALVLSLLMLAGSTSVAWAQIAAPEPAPTEDTTKAEGRTPEMGMMKMGMMKNCPMMRGMMQGGMKGGMMQRMASDAVGQSVMQVYLLPALRDSLSLSDDQAARLEDLKQQFAAQRDEIQADSRAQERQFDEVMGAEQPDLGRAEALLTDRAALEADAQMAALRAAARMKEVLSGEQRAELAALEPIQMHRAMMQNLPMRDMMQMMGDMMMADMQMSCPMMKDGMPMGHGDMTGHGDAMQQENE